MLTGLPPWFQVALALAVQLGLTWAVGGGLLRAAGLRSSLQREAWPVRLFAATLLGGVVLPSAYAVLLLEGQTVAVLVLAVVAGLLLLARRLRTGDAPPPLPPLTWATRIVLLACGLLVALYYPVQCVHGGEFPWQIIRSDNSLYSHMARFLAEGFSENDRLHENLLTTQRLAPTPYHYFEMWNSCWLARWSGLPHLAALQPVHAAQFVVVCWVGVLALAAQLGRLGSLQVLGATLVVLFKPDFILYIYSILDKYVLNEIFYGSILAEVNSLFLQDLSFIGLYSELANIQVKTTHINAVLVASVVLAVRRQLVGAVAALVVLPLLAVGSVGLMLVTGGVLAWFALQPHADRPLARLVLLACRAVGGAYALFYLTGLQGGTPHALAVGGLPAPQVEPTLIAPQPAVGLVLARLPLILLLLWGPLVGLACWMASPPVRWRAAGYAAALLGSGLVAWWLLEPVLVADANQFFLVALPVFPLLVAVGLFQGQASGRRGAWLAMGLLAAGTLWQVRQAWTRSTVWYGPDQAFLAAAAQEAVRNPVGGYLPNLTGFESRIIFERMLRIQGLRELYVFSQYAGNEALVNCDSLPQAQTQSGRWLAEQSFFTRWARQEQTRHGPLPVGEQQLRFVARHGFDWLLLGPGVELPAWANGRVRHRLRDPKSGYELVYLK